jgi:hypothetical protein
MRSIDVDGIAVHVLTLSRKAGRDRTAKAERKLLAKNSPTGSVRGGSETAILATGGKVLPGSRSRFRGAHAGQRWRLRPSICDCGTGGVKRPGYCAITQKSPTPFSEGGSRQHRYHENPAKPKQRGNQITTPVEKVCPPTALVASAPQQQFSRNWRVSDPHRRAHSRSRRRSRATPLGTEP